MTPTSSSLRLLLSTLVLASGLTGVVRAETCVVAHTADGTDDSPAILAAFKQCALDSIIEFEQADYQALTPVSLTGLRACFHILRRGDLILLINIRKRHDFAQRQPQSPK